MTFSLKELRAASDDDLIRRHDNVAKTTGESVDYYLEELARRDQKTATDTMVNYTWRITVMTFIVTLATIVNVVLAGVMLWKIF